jgi:hypothetical protein
MWKRMRNADLVAIQDLGDQVLGLEADVGELVVKDSDI